MVKIEPKFVYEEKPEAIKTGEKCQAVTRSAKTYTEEDIKRIVDEMNLRKEGQENG